MSKAIGADNVARVASATLERIKAWAPVVAWALVIFALSSIPGTSIPDVGFSFADKVAHICVYGVLGVLFFRAWRRQAPALNDTVALLVSALCTLTYGISDEFHQLFVPNRSADIFDLVADLIGGVLGGLAVIAARRVRGAGPPSHGAP